MSRYLTCLIVIMIAACEQPAKKKGQDIDLSKIDLSIEWEAEVAEDWTNLFYRKEGWFAADGIFSIPLTGEDRQGNIGNDSTLIIFSDTYVGKVVDNKPDENSVMVNNTVAYFQGTTAHPDSIRFYYNQDESGVPTSFFEPKNEKATEKDFYWLGDGFVNQELDNRIYLFTYHVERTGDNVFDFIEPDVSMVTFGNRSIPPFDDQRQFTTPLHVTLDSIGEGNLGAGILVNTKWAGAVNPDGYVYVYGCIGSDKSMVVSRVRPAEIEDFEQWRYWNGSNWGTNPSELKPITNAVSNELSVTPLPDGRFAVIFQVMGLSDKVGMRIAASPTGPFSEIHEIFRTPEIDEGLWPYNAKAHFNLSQPGELLISYNTITPDFWKDILEDAHIYRPRFIRLKFKNLK